MASKPINIIFTFTSPPIKEQEVCNFGQILRSRDDFIDYDYEVSNLGFFRINNPLPRDMEFVNEFAERDGVLAIYDVDAPRVIPR